MAQSLSPVQSPDATATRGGGYARLLTILRGLGPGRLAVLGVAAAGLLGFFAYCRSTSCSGSGAADGAAKFVRGDAIAGLLITFINLVGGLIIGVGQMG